MLNKTFNLIKIIIVRNYLNIILYIKFNFNKLKKIIINFIYICWKFVYILFFITLKYFKFIYNSIN